MNCHILFSGGKISICCLLYSSIACLVLTLKLPVTTIVSACDFKSHFCKQCGPRSDCSSRSSLIRVHTVCQYAKNRFVKLARLFSRLHKQTTFSDAGFLGILRVNVGRVCSIFTNSKFSRGQNIPQHTVFVWGILFLHLTVHMLLFNGGAYSITAISMYVCPILTFHLYVTKMVSFDIY